ncbi:MAG: hypothetical protein E7484_03610 [Ruminococcaceae bacterium]|nr:hypothetical protein [Oscillospiraceae bacterium]
MPFILITFTMTVITLGVMIVSEQSFIKSLPLALSAVIITGYAAALTGFLPLAVWLVRLWMVVSAVLCLHKVYQIFKQKKLPDINVFVQIIIFAGAMAVLWWLCRGRMFSDWDEFSFWGIATKFTYFKDTLYTSPLFNNGFKSYPPAQIILQYLMLKTPAFSFREDVVIYISAMFSMSLLIYPAGILADKKKYITAAVAAVMMFIVPAVIIDHPYYLTTVDMQIGIIAAFIILVCSMETKAGYRAVAASLGAMVLTLYKSSGYGIAMIACIAAAVTVIFGDNTEDNKVKKYLYAAMPFVMATIAKFSWKIHTDISGVEERWTAGAGNTIIDLFTGNALDYQKQVLQSFAEAFFKTESYGGLFKFSPFGWVIIAAVIAAIAVVIAPQHKKKTIIVYVASIAGYLIFAVSQLYTYLFVFEPLEAVQLASFHRYLSTPILMMVTVAAAYLCYTAVESRYKTAKTAVVFMMAALFVITPMTMSFCKKVATAPVMAAQTQHDRYLYIRTSRYIKQLGAGQDTKLFLVSANDAGWTQMLVEYELFPDVTLPQHMSIIAANAMENQPWVEQLSAEQWSRKLHDGFDYVYIHCPEDQFVADYLSVFEDESQVVVDRMFEVIRKEDGTAVLRRIEMQPEDGYI